jgi:hypothetical protein
MLAPINQLTAAVAAVAGCSPPSLAAAETPAQAAAALLQQRTRLPTRKTSRGDRPRRPCCRGKPQKGSRQAMVLPRPSLMDVAQRQAPMTDHCYRGKPIEPNAYHAPLRLAHMPKHDGLTLAAYGRLHGQTVRSCR